MKVICIIILFLTNFLFLFTKASCQTAGETYKMRSAFIYPNNNKDYEFAKNNTNEIQLLFSSAFLFYKNFISSQDGGSCSFTPSCSEYGIEAVKKQGVIFGIINTFDRLTRCNSLSPENYKRHTHTNLLYDPCE